MPTPTIAEVIRDYVTYGVPSSGAHKPRKADWRAWGTWVEQLLAALAADAGGVTELPELIYYFTVTGGTANAIVATPNATPPTAPGAALLTMTATAVNSGAVTLNGKPLRANGGEELQAGEVHVGDLLAFLDLGAEYRLITDPGSLRNKLAAMEWATNPEDDPVSPEAGGDGATTFSAKHWAAKSNEEADRSEVARAGSEAARDIAAGYASDAVSQGNVPIYATVAGMSAIEVPAGINAVWVNGDGAAGDGKAGLFVHQDNGMQSAFSSGGTTARPWYPAAAETALSFFNADGITDDTANFAALRAAVPFTDFDLKGKTFRVSAIPSGPFHNGYFQINGAGEGGGNIRFPAPNTLKADVGKIAYGDRHSNWPQDACHAYNGVIYAMWKEGDDHTAADTHVRMARSFDNGKTWSWFERLFQSLNGARSCWAAAAVGGGMQVMAVREHNGLHSDPQIVGTRLYQRRLGERREKKNYPETGDFTAMEIRTTSGSSTVRVANCARHGLREGEKVAVTNVGPAVGGLSISGEFTVTGRGSDWFEFAHPSGNASATETANTDFVIDFVESAAPRQVNVDGTTLSEAVRAFPGSAYAGTSTFYFHSMVENPNDLTGGCWIGVSGGGQVPHIAYIDNLYYAACRVAKLVPINVLGTGEPTIKRLPDGTLFGFLRSNSAGTTGGFFYSTDNGDSFSIRLNVTGSGNDYQYSPIPCATDGNTIYAVATGNRVRGVAGTMLAGDVPLYLLEGEAASVLANGIAGMTVTRIGSLTFANESHGDTGNGVGAGSIVYNDGVLHIFEATENAENRAKPFGSPDILHIRLQLKDDAPDYAKGVQEIISPRSTDLILRGEASRQTAGRFVGYGAAHMMGRVLSDATAQRGHGFTAAKGGTGVYNITFDKPLPTNKYYVFAISSGNGNASPHLSAEPSATGFQVAMRNVASSGGLIDAAFTFIVFLDSQFTRTDWQGDL